MKDKEFQKHVGLRIKKRRLELKLTQQALAYCVGLSNSFYSDVERGKRGIGLENAFYLASELGVSMDYFTEGWLR